MHVNNRKHRLCEQRLRRQVTADKRELGATTVDAKVNIWAGDTLGRKADAEFLIDFLLGRIEQRGRQGLSRSYVLNVDAGWGGGKTFFMSRLAQELRQRDIAATEIDAWQDDHAEDPILSLMSGIEATINPLVRGRKALQSTYKTVRKTSLTIASAAAKGAAKQLLHKIVGESAKAITDEIEALKDTISEKTQSDLEQLGEKAIDKSAEALLEGFEEGKKSIKYFKEQLAKLIEQIREGTPNWALFVLIDELDRCRPTHAIALLERIKHLFDVDNVVFVIATDTNQLSESVKAVYGAGFDGKKYLTRFFDRTFHFPDVSVENFATSLMNNTAIDYEKLSVPPGIELIKIVVGSIKAFDALPREVRRAIEIIADTLDTWPKSFKMEASILVPLAVGMATSKIDITNSSSLNNAISTMKPQSITIDMSNYCTSAEIGNVYKLSDLMEGLVISGRDFASFIMHNPDNAISRWCHSRLIDEHNAMQRDKFRITQETRSIIWSYPQILAATGRLHSQLS